MDVRITPEPEDRDAVLAAVQALLARDALPVAYRSRWRERGVLENLDEDDDQGETVRPRSSPGATRA
ncbi:MAG: hypothetical protein QOG06_1610 [Gaiellaceae bacterium]|nr:hypothetical protein [Gaiellaceae bacterium]